MSYRFLLATMLVLPLSGCAVYGDDYNRGYRGHYPAHHYYNGYRRDYSPPVYVTQRYYYYDDRRHDRHPPVLKRYVPVSPPRQHGVDYGVHKRHDSPSRHDGWRDNGRRHDSRDYGHPKQYQGLPSGKSWEGGRSQQVQQRYSRDHGRSRGEQPHRGEWRRY